MSPDDALLKPRVFADAPRVRAGFSTRAFAPVAEPLPAVRARLARAEAFAGAASVGQVHGADVAVVQRPGHVPAHDGLVTDTPGLLLTVLSADCALVLLADPEAGVVGACHAGWRGAVAGVLGRTLHAMAGLGARPAHVRAYVGPCISAEAFEVGDEVAAQFEPEAVVRRAGWPRPHVDLRASLVRQLRQAGLGEGRIEVSEACTASDTQRFYSYRAEAGQTGRMLGYIGLVEGGRTP